MSQAPSVALAVVDRDNLAPQVMVSLKGTTRGLEIHIARARSAQALGARLTELLSEAPSFFAGSDARVAFEGTLPAGALACLEDVAARFELKLVEIGPAAPRPRSYAAVVRRVDGTAPRRGTLAEGTGPITEAAAREAAPSAALPALPDGVPEVPEVHEVPEATPIEVALANTAPYSIMALLDEATAPASPDAAPVTVAGAAEPSLDEPSPDESSLDVPPYVSPADALAIEAALACAVSIELAVTHAAAAIATMTVPAEPAQPAVTEAAIAALAERRAVELAQGMAAELAEGMADALAATRAVALAEQLAAPLAEARAVALAAQLATPLAEARAAELVAAMAPGPRLVIGPVRSGVIVDHTGHVIVIGDVNPGAEVRAEGSIIVLGRLRGVAHAAIGRDAGCIVALSLQPQQLRIGRMVARAGDADRPSDGAEIAYATGETIVVERFVGRLPSGLAASM